MIEISTFKPRDTFFAAQNSLNGFVSSFNTVFAPEKYAKLYILKGGPGTGKSTLMRGIVSFANKMSIDCDAVLCSSDTYSLDGVILEKGDRRIAIIDGTAPHTRDAVYPGAVDEIINLGEGFDKRYLEENREKIIGLSNEKSASYRKAYSSLFAAKGVFDYIWDNILKSRLYKEAEIVAKAYVRECNRCNTTEKYGKVLYSAFGKDGYKRLPLNTSLKVVEVSGNEFICAAFMSLIKQELIREGMLTKYSPSALDERLTDRLYCDGTVFASSEERDSAINLYDYKPEKYIEDYSAASKAYYSLLDVAVSHFAAASEIHFRLENIYSKGVDFENNERVYASLIEKIAEHLS